MAERGGLKLVHILLLLGVFFVMWLPSKAWVAIASPLLSDESKKAYEIQDFAQSLGEKCSLTARCENLFSVDCGAAMDGSLYYYNADTMEPVSECGGICRDPSKCPEGTCPPKEWMCDDKGKPLSDDAAAEKPVTVAPTDTAPLEPIGGGVSGATGTGELPAGGQ